ncbi:MAG: surface lipoprotein assembly modifier [Neisseria sp.]|nr:surface lipoprotein assembly modifier [Neisseria sp.]
MLKKTLTFLLISAPLYGEDLPVLPIPVPEPLFFENETAPIAPPLREEVVRPSETAGQVQTLTEAQLRENPELLVHLINQAVVGKRWDMLADLLALYRETAAPDQTLIAYAEGALLRGRGEVGAAVARYREIVAAHPDLPYVKLDLGLMLAEDKQYREAERVLAEVEAAEVTPATKRLAAAYRAAAVKAQAWQPDVSLQYERTDNVNNASDERIIEWQGQRWTKSADSLPQSAEGFRYGLGVQRDLNVGGHHFAHFNLRGDGVHYWDNQDYSEQSLRVAAGYKNQNARRSWGVIPFVEQNWLGGSRYSRLYGANLEYSRVLSPRWQLMLNASRTEKRYQEAPTAARYNGFAHLLSATALYRAADSWLLFGGLDQQWDNTREKADASARSGIRIGTVKTFKNGLGTRLNLRYARRAFDAPATLVYEHTRNDHEYQAQAALWHRKVSWKGFTPRLNFRYLKIDSNMPAFYSRSSGQWFVSVEKAF